MKYVNVLVLRRQIAVTLENWQMHIASARFWFKKMRQHLAEGELYLAFVAALTALMDRDFAHCWWRELHVLRVALASVTS